MSTRRCQLVAAAAVPEAAADVTVMTQEVEQKEGTFATDAAEGERERLEIGKSLSLSSAILLVARRRWPKVLLAVLSMVGATSVILAAPLFSSGVIEILVGQRPDAEFSRLLGSLIIIYGVVGLALLTHVIVQSVYDTREYDGSVELMTLGG
jgi:hypothetical protein